jgi:hypothetical protein
MKPRKPAGVPRGLCRLDKTLFIVQVPTLVAAIPTGAMAAIVPIILIVAIDGSNSASTHESVPIQELPGDDGRPVAARNAGFIAPEVKY